MDLPTDRPDLVWAYWGYSLEDALDRGRVEVTKVESYDQHHDPPRCSSCRVPAVYATFYYNTLVDQAYSVACATAGASGAGTYSVTNENGDVAMLTPQFGAKSCSRWPRSPWSSRAVPSAHRTAVLRFPSLRPAFVGAVEEDVTVTFASQDATLAKYAVPWLWPLLHGAERQ